MSADKDIEALRGMVRMLSDRVADLEAEIATLRGTLAPPGDDDQPTIIHDVVPNAPR